MFSIRTVIELRTLQLLISLIVAVVSAYSTITGRLELLVISTIALLAYIVVNTNLAVMMLLLTAFFGTTLSQLEIIPQQFNWLTETIILTLFLRMVVQSKINRKGIYFFGWKIVLVFFPIVVISTFVNSVDPIRAILFLRLVFRFYLVMVILTNLYYEERFMPKVNYPAAELRGIKNQNPTVLGADT